MAQDSMTRVQTRDLTCAQPSDHGTPHNPWTALLVDRASHGPHYFLWFSHNPSGRAQTGWARGDVAVCGSPCGVGSRAGGLRWFTMV